MFYLSLIHIYRLHNYQRSQEMNNTLNEAGIEDSIENNQMIVEKMCIRDRYFPRLDLGTNTPPQTAQRFKSLPR